MKKTRLFICALLVVLMLVPVGVANVSAAEADVWDGTSVTENWYDDSATTLVIDSAADLAAFIKSGKTFSGKTIELQCDIVWNKGDASKWSTTNAPANAWTALTSFQGTFNGNGHCISGIYSYIASHKTGFFTEINGATINDLAIVNSYFCAMNGIVGGIAGMARANNTIDGCYVNAIISATNNNGQVGGLIGQAYNNAVDGTTLTIKNCMTEGVFTADLYGYVGGMIGISKGVQSSGTLKKYIVNMTDCLSTATVTSTAQTGGLIGKAEYTDATLTTCYYNGDLYSWSSGNYGGIVGGFGGNATYNGITLKVNACYYGGNFYKASGGTYIGTFAETPTRVGDIFSDSISVTNLSDVTTTYATALYGAWDSSSTYYTDSTNDNSTERSGTMAGVGAYTAAQVYGKVEGSLGYHSVLKNSTPQSKAGGLSDWLKVATNFTTDAYGNIRLKTLSLAHDCADHYGDWFANGTSQKRVCTYGGCLNEETRGASFEIVGSSIRYEDHTGIRFLTRVDKNEFFKQYYSGDTYAYQGAAITFGTVIIPTDLLDGELTVDTQNALNIEAKKLFDTDDYVQNDNTFYYSAVVIDLPEDINTYNRDLAARSYAKYEDNGETVYIYSDTKVTSFYDVAEMAYADSNTNQSIKEGLNMTLALGAVSEDFYSENPDKVQILEYATPDLFNEYAASLEAQGFKKHTNYEYSDNLFGLYYNDDFVVSFYYTPLTIANYVEPDQEWYAYGNAITEDMSVIENERGVTVDDAENIMRVIVEKREDVDLPATRSENIYTRNDSITNSIAQIFPNDNYAHYGMGYIVQLADGSFIVIDGGENVDDPRNKDITDTDSDLLYQYMSSMVGEGEKPVIAAWILTHRHNDHVDVFKAFAEEYYDRVEIEQVILNFAAGSVAVPTESREVEMFAEHYVGLYFPDAKIVTAHTGYKFYIRNAEITILYSIDDLAPFDLTKVFTNNESIAFDMIIDGEQRIMFTGEIFIPGSHALVNMYGEDLKSDVIQLSHHGHYGATEEVYKYIWPAGVDYTQSDKFVLWPIGNEEQRRTRLSLAENVYITNRLQQLGITDYMSKIHSAVDLIFASGAVTDTSGSKETDDEVITSGAIGKWEIIPLYTSAPDYDTLQPWPWSN